MKKYVIVKKTIKYDHELEATDERYYAYNYDWKFKLFGPQWVDHLYMNDYYEVKYITAEDCEAVLRKWISINNPKKSFEIIRIVEI